MSSNSSDPSFFYIDVSEKNKKCIVEQKRFYQRKLTGLTSRLFRLLKPPLQRRNSCPVLSEQKPPQRPQPDKQQGRSCKLTKWISHSELKSLTTVTEASTPQCNAEHSLESNNGHSETTDRPNGYTQAVCSLGKVNSLPVQCLKDDGDINGVGENSRLSCALVAQDAKTSNCNVNNLSKVRLGLENDFKCLSEDFSSHSSKVIFLNSPTLTFGSSNGFVINKTKQCNIDSPSSRNINSYGSDETKSESTDVPIKVTKDIYNPPNTSVGNEVIKIQPIKNETEPIYAVVNKVSVDKRAHLKQTELNQETLNVGTSEKYSNGFIVCNGSYNNTEKLKLSSPLNSRNTGNFYNEPQKTDGAVYKIGDESLEENVSISNNFVSSYHGTSVCDKNGSIKSQINIICKQANETPAAQTNHCQNGGIRISISNGRNDVLDFGECTMNALANELQSCQINECYNVKLDAPEEVIVAGFHDFCHTMLSLEESLEDTGTVKRNPGYKRNKNSTGHSAGEVINNEYKNSHSLPQSLYESQNPESDMSISSSSTDKILEDIQNSKSLGKMSLKDPDVMDAIQTLDKSLMEHSDDSYLDVSDSNPKICNATKERPASLQKIIKEDKIQCDNLIEELMLEDINKKITPSDSSIPNPTVTNNFEADERGMHNTDNSDYWLSTKLCSEKSLESVSDVNSSNLDDISSEAYGSDLCDSDEVTKRVNRSFDTKSGDSSILEVSRECLDLTSQSGARRTALQDACNRTSPCSVDSGTSSHSQGFFVVVAIDFGTTYSGYAFSFTRDPDNIHMMKKWEGGDPGVFNQKTPTTLLLTPEGTFHSFGYSARDYYHDLDEEEAKGWLYFEKFKMTLHHNEHLSLETKIAAANGQCMPAVTVFAHALRYFKDHALQELSDQSATRILNEDVRWVVTVPAIWKQPAKQFMRAAAYQAGIASPEYPEQLLIALEPEAASIYCRRIRLHQLVPDDTHMQRSCYQWQKDTDSETSSTNEKEFSPLAMPGIGNDGTFSIGTRYMVVDCGGGTVDITVHELLDKQGTLKELQKASGGPYGSIRVDMEFEQLLCDIFGEDFIQQFKSKRPIGFVDLMIAFEARKRNVNPYKNNPLNISLPFSFIDFYKKFKGSSVEATIKKSSHKNVKWSSQGMLRLEPSVMEGLFKRTVEKIRLQIEKIINEKDMNIDHIFLVGGFAESLILQKEIKDAFSSTVKVVIPQGVSLAILKGAVLYGLDPTAINIRRLRMTYGVGVLNRFIHGVHPREKLVVKDGIQWCADVFDKFVVNEQSVDVGDVVVRCYTPAKDGQSCSVIHIYCSEKEDIYFITDPGVKRCATLILDLSESRYIQDREIQTQMMFGDTEIKVSALDVTTGKCVKADIDFLNL